MKLSTQQNNVSRLRVFINLRQRQLAPMIKCPTSTLQAIELNRLALSEHVALAISYATNVSVGWLLRNDLQEPITDRQGKPYSLMDFVCAQSGQTLTPDANALWVELSNTILRLHNACSSLLSADVDSAEVALARLQKMSNKIETDLLKEDVIAA